MSSVTMNAKFADNPAFLEYQDLLVQIQHALCRGDNETAARLCDASEEVGQRLSITEIQWLQWLSSDLEMLCDDELFQPMEQTKEEYAHNVIQAWLDIEIEPEKMLRLLRYGQDFLPPSRVAYARARAYDILGYKNLKKEFLRCAVRLDPENVEYKLFLLNAIGNQTNLLEGLKIVEEIYNNKSSTLLIKLIAVGDTFMHTQYLSPHEARPVLGRLRGFVEPIIKQNQVSNLDPKMTVFGLLLLGGIFEGLNRSSSATDCYKDAYNLAPNDDGVMVALGGMLFKSNQSQAISLFEQAVALNTRFPLPYLHLAAKELNAENYKRAGNLAQQVLELEVPSKIRAYALEILGITKLSADSINEDAIRHFEEAVALAPDNNRLRENYNEVLRMHQEQKQKQDYQLINLRLIDFDTDSFIAELDTKPKQFLSERLTSLSALSSKNESSRLSLAA